ncbi:unnamed protein product [Adineta ricciae]|uniref:Uncharacterized protein n=1 Tax=Adineta ricciae TaxID=249248 RepID=A0A813ZMD8_ADIRI|nr:unnamed protein product [Adineta ricciae]CAF1366525.1 unnamed protein product [Adineta ricciae]
MTDSSDDEDSEIFLSGPNTSFFSFFSNNNFLIRSVYSILTKKRILIGSIILLLSILLLITSIKLFLINKNQNLLSYNGTQTSAIQITTERVTTINQSPTNYERTSRTTRTTNKSTFTLSPKSCSIPSINATWNQSGIIFINPLDQCRLTEHSLCNPRDIFIDDVHNTFYVADVDNNRIQKYFLNETYNSKMGATGITVASEGLILPQSIFVDIRTEDMYILDLDRNPRVNSSRDCSFRVHLWKKNESIGRILFSRRGEIDFGYFYHHLTLDKDMNIYVGTRFFIMKWLVSTNYTEKVVVAGMHTIKPSYSTDVYDPITFFVTDDFTLYVADWKNKRIQQWKINASEGTTVIGDLPTGLGITLDCNGYLYFIETKKYTISQFNMETNQTRLIVSFGHYFERSSFHSPQKIQMDKLGNIYFIDLDQVFKFSIVSN